MQEKLGIDHALDIDADIDARLLSISNGEIFDVVFDATVTLSQCKVGFATSRTMARTCLCHVVNADVRFSAPEFHKREARLMASRNATTKDFEFAIECIRANKISTAYLHTQSAPLVQLPARLGDWLKPECRVIKAVVEC